MENLRQNGLHLIGTLINCDINIMKDLFNLYFILKKIPESIGMTVLEMPNNPTVSKCESEGYEHSGYTGTVILLESHFCFHCWPEYEAIDFDIFSCKEFDYIFALKEIRLAFNGDPVGVVLLERGHFGAKQIQIKEDLNEVE